MPLSAILLRKNFGKSILVTTGFWICVAMIFDCVLFYYVGKLGYVHLFWAVPISTLFIVIVFEILKKKIKKPLVASVMKLKEISLGNLNFKIDQKLLDQNDELGLLSNGINDLINNLDKVLGDIRLNSENIASASVNLDSASRQISETTNVQAASIEELSSSMEEMVSNVEQSKDNSQQTEKIAQLSAEGIREVASSSEKSLNSVRTITEKIEIINDIAFQTNILALNAAVEAARAGEQGKGFAVVAGEVRKLAERSNEAANQIFDLSKETLHLTEQAVIKLNSIVPEIEKTAKLVQEITASGLEQNNGAVQINLTIQQFNQVSQRNALSSEELATSAMDLANWAKRLKELIAYFKTTN
jgi:methyl-accepting chemotaxis protein